jgi:hypothetical protein
MFENRGTADRKPASKLTGTARLAGRATQKFSAGKVGERSDCFVQRPFEDM